MRDVAGLCEYSVTWERAGSITRKPLNKPLQRMEGRRTRQTRELVREYTSKYVKDSVCERFGR